MTPGRAVITGISGFVGRHQAANLETQGYEVTGFGQGTGPDVRYVNAVIAFMDRARPTVVVHLAASRSADTSDLHSVNVLGAVAVEASSRQVHRPRILLVSSSAVGASTGEAEVDEQSPASIAAIEAEVVEPTLRTSELNKIRDFTDVRDAFHGYVALLEAGSPGGVYNVCSGEPTSIQRCLDILLSLSTKAIKVEVDPSRTSQGDIDRQVGSPRGLRDATHWRPLLSFEQSLSDMLAYERRQTAA